MKEDLDRDAAERRVRDKVGFFAHGTTYVCVMALLVTINLLTNPAHLWFVWPLLGWGVGLLAHAVGVFLGPRGARIFDRMVEHGMRRDA